MSSSDEGNIVENIVVYEWCDSRNRWFAYDPSVSNFIGQYHSAGQTVCPIAEVNEGFKQYHINLTTLKQVNTTTGRERNIRREVYNQDFAPIDGAVWEFEGDDTWETFNKRSSEALEHARKNSVETIDLSSRSSQSHQHTINLTSMTQTRISTGKVRKILRTPFKYLYITESDVPKLREEFDKVSLKSSASSSSVTKSRRKYSQSRPKQDKRSRNRVEESKCDYQKACEAFKNHLDLPKADFLGRHDKCYCSQCYNGDPYATFGNRPKKFSIPTGWFRFSLRAPSRAISLEAFQNWNRAFHGTAVDKLKSILHVGEIVPAGRSVLGGTKIKELDGHFSPVSKPDGFDTEQVFVSPSIIYAGVDTYARPDRFEFNGKAYKAKVAFQVLINPDSFKVGPQTVGAKSPIDPVIGNDKLEWMTNEQGSTILYGLLVKLE